MKGVSQQRLCVHALIAAAGGLIVVPSNPVSPRTAPRTVPHAAVAQELMAPATTAADLRLTLDPLVDGGGVSAILEAASYEPFASLRIGSETFVLAKGASESWDLLSDFEDVKAYEPPEWEPPKGDHVLVCHFASTTTEGVMRGLERARDQYAMMSPASEIVACAFDGAGFKCETSAELKLYSALVTCADIAKRLHLPSLPFFSGISTAVRNHAHESGIVILSGDILALWVNLVAEEADTAAAKTAATKNKQRADAAETALIAAETALAAKDTALAELAEATTDPALRVKLEEILRAGTTSGAE